jgi:hypothetical protein
MSSMFAQICFFVVRHDDLIGPAEN